MTTRIFNIALFLFLSVGLFAQRSTGGLTNTASSTANQAADARTFGLTVVKAYFDFQCSFVYEKLATEITNFTDGVKVQKSSVAQATFCAKSPLRTDMRVQYYQYLENYNPEVLDHTQFAIKYPQYQRFLQLKAGDFYFGGNVLKSGGLELFKNPDAVRFVVRKNARGAFEITML